LRVIKQKLSSDFGRDIYGESARSPNCSSLMVRLLWSCFAGILLFVSIIVTFQEPRLFD